MCGICGIVYHDPTRPVTEELVQSMNNSIHHRGPDDSGVYVSNNVGLGFRRLAIIDLSPAGHQPMTNEDGSVWIVFNGEIVGNNGGGVLFGNRIHKSFTIGEDAAFLHIMKECSVNDIGRSKTLQPRGKACQQQEQEQEIPHGRN